MSKYEFNKSYNRYHYERKEEDELQEKPQRTYRKSKKEEYEERLRRGQVGYTKETRKDSRSKKAQVDNPAAALVTQVPQGATKPVVDPTQQQVMTNQAVDHILLAPPKDKSK